MRSTLREGTQQAHDQLDAAMRTTGWSTRESYAQFLQFQLAARQPIEAWIAAHCTRDLAPPPQCGLIARDLDTLGQANNGACFAFEPDNTIDPVGMAWALAGSSLGNRAILREIERFGGQEWPSAFLADDAMQAFWRQLKPLLEAPADQYDVEAAAQAALAVFEHFQRTVHAMSRRLAA